MKSIVLAGFNWTYMSNFVLLLFLGLFIGILIWVFRKGSDEIYDEAASMLLKEEGKNE